MRLIDTGNKCPTEKIAMISSYSTDEAAFSSIEEREGAENLRFIYSRIGLFLGIAFSILFTVLLLVVVWNVGLRTITKYR